MKTFLLRIGTPDGFIFEGEAERVICRTRTGDQAVLAGHCDFCAALDTGDAVVVLADGSRKTAVCKGGMLTMINGVCRLLAAAWEWEKQMDE